MPPEPLTRFAPSPTGHLHLGHAYSALTAWGRPGRCLLRIEDIDRPRCRPEFEAAIFEDLRWLGLRWPEPVWRQSVRGPCYAEALRRLAALGLCYPCRCTRAEIRAALSAPQEGAAAPVYPGLCRGRSMADAGPQDAIRLDLARALALTGPAAFTESGPMQPGRHPLEPDRMRDTLGDVVLARRDIGTSYHLAVVVDDAAQGISEIVRGVDLFEVTPLHRLLQILLELPAPTYWHHDLVRDPQGRRLAKRDADRAIRRYRAEGASPADVAAMVGLRVRG